MTKRIEDGEEMARAIADFMNVYGFQESTFIETLVYRTHRTLQQTLFGVMLKMIYKWAEMYENERFDLRNEDTCRISKQIKDALGEEVGVSHI